MDFELIEKLNKNKIETLYDDYIGNSDVTSENTAFDYIGNVNNHSQFDYMFLTDNYLPQTGYVNDDYFKSVKSYSMNAYFDNLNSYEFLKIHSHNQNLFYYQFLSVNR